MSKIHPISQNNIKSKSDNESIQSSFSQQERNVNNYKKNDDGQIDKSEDEESQQLSKIQNNNKKSENKLFPIRDENVALIPEIVEYLKKINRVLDKKQQKNFIKYFSQYSSKKNFKHYKRMLVWIFNNQFEFKDFEWLDGEKLNQYKYSIDKQIKTQQQLDEEIQEVMQTEDKDKFILEFEIKFIVIKQLIYEICSQIKDLGEDKLKIIFEGKDLQPNEIEDIILVDKRFYFDYTWIFLQNTFSETKNFDFLQNKEQIKTYLNKHLNTGKNDLIQSKVKADYFGLLLWIAPFTDQIFDIIYLRTGEFYVQWFFYLYLLTFLSSLIGVFINVFYGVFKNYKANCKEGKISNIQIFLSIPFIKTTFIFICTWLRIDEFIYLLGYRKFIRDHFKPEIKVGYQNLQFVYNDPQQISMEQRMNQKIELYAENILQFIVLIINQSLLSWSVFNLAQSSLSFTIMIISIIQFYIKDNNLIINKIQDFYNYILIMFGHVNKGIGLIYAITVLCLNLVALNELDLLDDSSDLQKFQPKFRSQIIFAIVAIVIDVFHFLIFIFLFQRREDRNDIEGVRNIKIGSRIKSDILIYYVFIIDYLMYAMFQIAYTYFEIKMYHTFYTELNVVDQFELNIVRFRFCYFMLIIFVSTYVFHPLIYLPIALYEIPIFILLIFFVILQLFLKCFRVDNEWISEKIDRLQEEMKKPFGFDDSGYI